MDEGTVGRWVGWLVCGLGGLSACLITYLPTFGGLLHPNSPKLSKRILPYLQVPLFMPSLMCIASLWPVLEMKKKIGSKQRIQKSHEKYPRGLTSRALWHELSGIRCQTRVFFSSPEFAKTFRIRSTWYYYCIPMVCALVLIQSG